MNYKLLRSDYYNEDYLMNKQEEKEFHLPLKSPYYKVRAKAFSLTGEVFGTYESFQHLISNFIFTSETNEPQIKLRKNKSELHKFYSTDLLQIKFTSTSSENSETYMNIEPQSNQNPKDSSIINFPPIYTFIPEINQMNKSLSYPEIYSAITNFADRQMLFINVFKENFENSLISGVLYFPYTPKDLLFLNDEIIFSLANFTKILQLTKEKFSNCSNQEIVKILRQKLYDIYYLCEDSRELHGVTDCHNFIKINPKQYFVSNSTEKKDFFDLNNSPKSEEHDQEDINFLEENKNLFPLELPQIFNNEYIPCNNLASFFCSNHMCKKCCELNTNISFCPIHDDIVNYYRDKMKDLLTFEQITHQFDNSTTLRIQVKNNISLFDLKNLFNNFQIDWEKNVTFYNEALQRIQFIYLKFKSHEDAKSLYCKRSEIDNKLQISIQPLLEDIKNIINKISIEQLPKSCLMAIPVSCIAKNDLKLPSKAERIKKIPELIENILKIDYSKYKLNHCTNILSNEMKSYDYFTVIFSDKSYLDKFYLNQPYFGGIIVHKLIHPIFFPKIRNKTYSYRNLCINCNNQKNPKCFFELCSNCCNYHFNNPSNNLIKNILNAKLGKCPCQEQSQNINNMASPFNSGTVSKVPQYEKYFLEKYNSMPNCGESFIQQYTLKRSINKLKILNYLRNGDFSWFKPIYDTNVTRMMLDMNKELTIIMDNPSYKREQPLKINDKMYKVFTYQIEKPTFTFYNSFSTEECFDENGDYFIEYSFDKKDIEKNKLLKQKFDNNTLNSNYNNNLNPMNNNNNLNTINSINYFNYIDKPKAFIDINDEDMESINVSNLHENNKKVLMSNEPFQFHIAIYGLDNERYTNHELIEELLQEIKGQNINIGKEDIQLIDEESILYNYFKDKKEINWNEVNNIGRVALIRFKSDQEALKLFCNRNFFNLSLVENKRGKPNMIVGQLLLDFIEKNQN